VDGVVPGCLVLLTIMRVFDIEEIEYCDMGLREGIILDYIGKHRAHLLARATWPDPRMRSVAQLAERCGYRRTHAEQVAKLALSLFDQLASLHGLDPRYRELLIYGCLLHDIGYLISHEGHHKHSYYLIRNGRLHGFSDQEIEIVGNLARYHRKGRPKKSDFSYDHLAKEHRPAVRKLLPLLRLANALDRTHYSVVQSVSCTVTADGVELEVTADQDAELELWTARRQHDFFEDSFGLPLRVTLKPADVREVDHADHDERSAPEAAQFPGPIDHRGGD
jgi:exopolyphosphatase/guanosine-5'-triphosphate,3'-diphosphate pyrophosphatase